MNQEDKEFGELVSKMLSWSAEVDRMELDGSHVVSVPDRERHYTVSAVIAGLIRAAEEAGAEYETDYEGLLSRRAFVSVTAERIDFLSPFGFALLAGAADNFEIYPLTDGTLKLDATFYHLQTKFQIGDKEAGI